MNDILNPNAPLTMTSKEIADLVDQRHDNVKRTIETLSSNGVITLPQIEEVSNTGPGPKTIRVYHVGKRDSLVVVAQLCPEFTANIVDRWQALEQQAATGFNPASLSRMDILKMAMDSEDGRIKAEAKLAIAAPKAQALDRISLSDGAMCVTNAAKVLGLQPKKLFAWLQLEQWIYRRAGGSGYVGYQNRVQVGYLDHKVTTIARSDGSEKTVEQVLITAKGLAKLASAIPGAGSSLVSA